MQFDVYMNPSELSRDAYPFLVDVQSKLIAKLSTRIVIPLGKLDNFGNAALPHLTPIVEYKGEEFLLLTPQISSVPNKVLKNPVGSLSHMRSLIIASLDFAVCGI